MYLFLGESGTQPSKRLRQVNVAVRARTSCKLLLPLTLLPIDAFCQDHNQNGLAKNYLALLLAAHLLRQEL